MKIQKKHILIINTGGTISMCYSPEGYVPAPGYIAEQLKLMPEFKSPTMPHYDLYEFSELLDSSNMHPRHWLHIAETIIKNYRKYDGFIVLHGTDTMAYTASALSFMLENLNKPVIVTGSQLPLAVVNNDARANLIHALFIAQNYLIPEVCLYFHNQLFRGNRAQKLNATHFDAFASPRFPFLARVGVEIEVNTQLLQPLSSLPIKLNAIRQCDIAVMKLFPGFPAASWKHILQPTLKGLIIESYGLGNAPSDDPAFINLLEEAAARQICIVNCSQCTYGYVEMQRYATGVALSKWVVSGHDMTIEAAVTKLAYLLNSSLTYDEVRHQMEQNLRGELSVVA